MIIDLATNNKGIVNYVKKTEGYGGKVEEKDGKYKLVNVQVDSLFNFYSGMLAYMRDNNIKWLETVVRVKDSRGKISGFGNQHSLEGGINNVQNFELC